MNKLFTLLSYAVLAAAAASAAPTASDLIAQIHFAGAGRITADPHAVAFTNLWCSPEAQALRQQTLDKLSRAPYAWFQSKTAPGAGDGTAQLRPLLDDLLSAEWLLQVRDRTNRPPEYALAVRLNDGRARLWQTNLESVLEAWTGMSVNKDSNGWNLKKHLPPDLIRFVRVGDWVVFGCGQDELPVTDGLVRRVQNEQRPAPAATNDWLTVDLNWPRLAQLFPALGNFDLPKISLQVMGTNDNLRLTGKLTLAQPLPPLAPWRIPTNTIRLPFSSFTAARGIATWLGKQSWAQAYEISPMPDQVFIWGMAQVPVQTFAAVPVPDAPKALAQLEQKLSTNTQWQDQLLMPTTMTATSNKLSWGGVPFIGPNVQAVQEPAGDFLVAEAFPNGPPGGPLPAELLAQFARPGLVYYHWEATGGRLKQLPHLVQLGLMFTRHKQFDASSAAGKWLDRIGPTLGSFATEATQTAPDELTFSRKAPAGLTAIELLALANWLEATNFPGCDLRLPAPPPESGSPPPPTPAAPAH